MVGLSHVALRLLVREYLPASAKTIWPTEMLSGLRLAQENVGETNETLRANDEDQLVPQILGNDEVIIAKAVAKLESWGARGIDINMGCPKQKILKHNFGVALMGDPEYAKDVVEMTVRNTGLPVSVKFRAGKDGDLEILKSFAHGIESAGASWVTLHPRTAEQGRRGKADWKQIEYLVQHLKIPVIGNGDIQTVQDIHRMREQTGCQMVMAGRALAARPWLMWQLAEDLGLSDRSAEAPRARIDEGAEYGRALLKLIELCRHYFSEEQAIRKIRFHIRMTEMWLVFGHTLIRISTKAKTLNEIEEGIKEFFKSEQEMVPTTDLRI